MGCGQMSFTLCTNRLFTKSFVAYYQYNQMLKFCPALMVMINYQEKSEFQLAQLVKSIMIE